MSDARERSWCCGSGGRLMLAAVPFGHQLFDRLDELFLVDVLAGTIVGTVQKP